MEYRDINQLLTAIRAFCRERGITCLITDDEDIIADIKEETSKKGNAGARVIILAGREKVGSDDFAEIRENKNVFIAGVGPGSERILELVRVI